MIPNAPAYLDIKFINRAAQVTAVNLKGDDFTKLTHKKEIQFLLTSVFFPDFDINRKSVKTGSLNIDYVNKLIDELKSKYYDNYNRLHFYPIRGVGPGEAALYYLLDQAHLGGGSSAGIDMRMAGRNYEIKAAQLSGDKKFVSQFKLGGTVNVSDLVGEFVNLKKALNLPFGGKGQNEVNKGDLEKIEKEFPEEYNNLVKVFKRRSASYFSGQNVIFVVNNNTQQRLSKSDGGKIAAIKTVQERDIDIDVVTQGTIKPKVKV